MLDMNFSKKEILKNIFTSADGNLEEGVAGHEGGYFGHR
jgi:hypothetical protein